MLEVTECAKEEIRYPVTRRNLKYGYIILFFSEKQGVVIDPGDKSEYNLGATCVHLPSCSDIETWERVNITITG